ncbi:HAD family hydrolase [Candidatus Dependentiae bacterium]|nr:HAD family hydrolase [Candidatus Dependentiae bacterium]
MVDHDSKALIWDLGNTLVHPSLLKTAYEIGLKDFILYWLIEGKDPSDIHESAFRILNRLNVQISAPLTATYHTSFDEEKLLPALICQWLTGKTDSEELQKKVALCMKQLSKKGHFSSRRQERLIKNTLKLIFDPKKFIQCLSSIPQGVSLLKECLEQYDTEGNQKHSFYILSNWDPHSFKYLYCSSVKEVICSFDPANIVISGDVGSLKPQAALFEYFLHKYSLNPKQCILIDDQKTNIIAAERHGITGLFVEKGNYASVRKHLQELKVV